MIEIRRIDEKIDELLELLEKNVEQDKKFKMSNFLQALVLRALCASARGRACSVAQRIYDDLLAQQNDALTWNYENSIEKRYPDDMDNTFCILHALYLFDEKYAGGASLRKITEILTRNEVAVGGPYFTWIFNNQNPCWKNIDPWVNANICAFLSHLDIHAKGLEKYLEDMLGIKNCSSDFYVSKSSLFYFLSYCKNLAVRLDFSDVSDDIFKAVAMIRCDKDAEKAIQAIFDNKYSDDKPIYIEEIRGNNITYAGSKTVMYALMIEALELYKERHYAKETHSKISIESLSILAYKNLKEKMINNSQDLCQALQFGIAAYDIFDEYNDSPNRNNPISKAIFYKRRMLFIFQRAIKSDVMIDYILTRIDRALYHEKKGVRPSNKSVYDKSIGLSLSVIGVLFANGYDAHSREFWSCLKFFEHFLLARQLCDDAHDWKEDMENNTSTQVTFLVKKYRETFLQDANFEYIFWNHVSLRTAHRIKFHTNRAQKYIRKMEICFEDTSFLSDLLSKYKKVADDVITEHKEMREFLENHHR